MSNTTKLSDRTIYIYTLKQQTGDILHAGEEKKETIFMTETLTPQEIINEINTTDLWSNGFNFLEVAGSNPCSCKRELIFGSTRA